MEEINLLAEKAMEQRALRKEWTALEEEERKIWDRVRTRHQMENEWIRQNRSVSMSDAEALYVIDGNTAYGDLVRITNIKRRQDAICEKLEPVDTWL